MTRMVCVCPLPTDRIRLNWVLKGISTTPAGLYKLDYDTPSGPTSLTARSVAMTIPAWALADVVKDKVALLTQQQWQQRMLSDLAFCWRRQSSSGIEDLACVCIIRIAVCCVEVAWLAAGVPLNA
jgi:hypothetical protein